jgi:hypothetical protein
MPTDTARQRSCVSHANRLRYANQLACETVDATVAAWHRNRSPLGLMPGAYLQKGYNLGVQWRFPPISKVLFSLVNAGIAQLVEQLICNQQVVGSNPTAGSITNFSRLVTCDFEVSLTMSANFFHLATSWPVIQSIPLAFCALEPPSDCK